MVRRTEDETLTYIGLQIKTVKQGITISQEDILRKKRLPHNLMKGKIQDLFQQIVLVILRV